jgi:hypothetical protein
MRYITSICVIAASLALSACGSTTTTSSTPGINSIKLQGGSASLSSLGGDGGSIIIDSFSDVKIKTDGTVATTFTLPTMSPVFGAVHVTVTGSPTVFVGNAPGAHPNGSLFVNLDADMNLHRVTDQLGGSEIVTGLTVPAGATLVLPVNDTVRNAAALIFPNSVVIDGKLTTTNVGGIQTNLYLEAGNAGSTSTVIQLESLLQVGSSGTVTTAGTTGAGGFLFLFSWGSMVNQGALDASGLTGSGGDAGFIELESFGFLYNTGTTSKVTAKGGSATAGSGGNGNRIGMTAFNASLNTNGALDNSGGDTIATGGAGGAGGAIYLLGGINDGSNPFGYAITTAIGKVLIGGTLTSNGGQSQDGLGGSAASNGALALGPGIFLESEKSGQLLVNARITAKGGATNGVAGGRGGTLNLNQNFGAALASVNPAPIEGIKLGSIIDLSGGASGTGGTGGAGGAIIIANDFSPDALPSSSTSNTTAGLPLIELDGYASINLSGGDAVSGGDAGAFHIYTASPMLASLVFPAPVISNAVAITATGGAGNLQTGNGGLGGSLDWRVGGNLPVGYNNAFQEQISILDSKGAINISGGAGNSGGTGGDLFFYGYTLKSTGAVNARGGKGTTTGGNGSALSLEMHATLNLTNSASISATGGSGITGGSGTTILLTAGNKVTNNGSILANGGAGTTTGGSGGEIDLQSEYHATTNSGSLNVAKGSGTGGVNGRVIIDFVEKLVPSSGTVI